MADPVTVRLLSTAVRRLGTELYRRHRLSQRAVDRKAFDKVVDTIAREARQLRATEFAALSDNDWAAAAECLKAAFDLVGELDHRVALDSAMNPARLAGWLRDLDPALPRAYDLTLTARDAYERLTLLACTAVVEFVRRHPEFPQQIEIEQLARLDRIESLFGPTDEDLGRFERRYCATVARRLDRLELFGVTLRDPEFRYPMSTAYISLTAHTRGRILPDSPQPLRIEGALNGRSRVLLLGEAGTGKTTLLQRLALWAARGEFPDELADWEGTVPFFIPLRHFTFDQAAPGPENFLDHIAPMLRAEQPAGWVQGVLRAGRGVLLVDGVDELTPEQRRSVAPWLAELRAEYPATRIVVTSRPSALATMGAVWEGFTDIALQPMTLADQQAFVAHWHDAVASDRRRAHRNAAESAQFREDLLGKLAARRHLRRLAANPLLCALICALHHERRMQLPEDRIKLYEAALEMLLVRRDEVRGVRGSGPQLGEREQESLIQKFAYWMIRNGHSEVARETAVERLADYLGRSTVSPAAAERVLDHLVTRSGVLREPSAGRVDFIHRTFQEFLAARQALEDGDLGQLVKRANEDDQWREVFVMSVGQARERERDKLIRDLMKRATRRLGGPRGDLVLLAADAVGNAPMIDPAVREEVARWTARLLPPASHQDAFTLSNIGEPVLDLLPETLGGRHEPHTDRRTYLIRLVAEIGGEAALATLARYAAAAVRDDSLDSRDFQAFETAWDYFEDVAYAQSVLIHLPYPADRGLTLASPRRVDAAALLPGLRWAAVDWDTAALENLHRIKHLTGLLVHAPPVGAPVEGVLLALRSCRDLAVVHILAPGYTFDWIDQHPAAGGEAPENPGENRHFEPYERFMPDDELVTALEMFIVREARLALDETQLAVTLHGFSPVTVAALRRRSTRLTFADDRPRS